MVKSFRCSRKRYYISPEEYLKLEELSPVKLETLQEYVLINQKRQRVECFRRNAEGLWVLHSYTQGSEIHLASVDFRASMDAIYEDVIFTNEDIVLN
ncbi:MAG: Uma2 family endonuclease [Microcoleus sp.]